MPWIIQANRTQEAEFGGSKANLEEAEFDKKLLLLTKVVLFLLINYIISIIRYIKC